MITARKIILGGINIEHFSLKLSDMFKADIVNSTRIKRKGKA